MFKLIVCLYLFAGHGVDTTVLKVQLQKQKAQLYYPLTTERVYQQNKNQLLWLAPDTIKMPAWEAMMLLDCVMQYGLNPADYHPKPLQYSQLNKLINQWKTGSDTDKANFDMLLTDAIIAFINNVHYGKLNPDHSVSAIDKGNDKSFDTATGLLKACQSGNFTEAIKNMQPDLKSYQQLQNHMRLLTGLYAGDCYEVPDETIRKMAINMERLRWLNNITGSHLQVNIPSYTLNLFEPDSTYLFKVIVGKPNTPTPTLQSKISHFTTAPDWKIPQSIFRKEILPKAIKDAGYLQNNHIGIYNLKGIYQEQSITGLRKIAANPSGYFARQSSGCDNALGNVVFRFANPYSVYLHDTPEPQLFNRKERALSHGCIRVENASNLAFLLLKYDGATNLNPVLKQSILNFKTMDFKIKRQLPICITYITASMKEGQLVIYPDVYKLDKSFELAMFGN